MNTKRYPDSPGDTCTVDPAPFKANVKVYPDPDGFSPRKMDRCPHCDRPGMKYKGRKCRVCGV